MKPRDAYICWEAGIKFSNVYPAVDGMQRYGASWPTRDDAIDCINRNPKPIARIRVIPKVKVYVISGMHRGTGEKTYLEVTVNGRRWSKGTFVIKMNTINEATKIISKCDAKDVLARIWEDAKDRPLWAGGFAIEEIWVKP